MCQADECCLQQIQLNLSKASKSCKVLLDMHTAEQKQRTLLAGLLMATTNDVASYLNKGLGDARSGTSEEGLSTVDEPQLVGVGGKGPEQEDKNVV